METGITADTSTRRVRCPACGHTSRGQVPEGNDLRCTRCKNLHKVWRSEAGKWQGREAARHRRRKAREAAAAIPKTETRWSQGIAAAMARIFGAVAGKGVRR